MKKSFLANALSNLPAPSPVLAVGLLASLLLASSLTGTLSAFTAAITNDQNTVSSGSLVMREQNSNASVTCSSTVAGSEVTTNSATCTSINSFGGATLKPGSSSSAVDITVANVGTLAASAFTLTPGACTVSKTGPYSGGATDLCSKLRLTVRSGSSTVFSGTLAAFSSGSPSLTMPAAPAAGVSVPFSFVVAFDDVDQNSYQGLTASVPLTWTFTS